MKPSLGLMAGLSALFLLGGCATSRSVLDIPAPAAGPASSPNGKQVLINSVSDKRVFEAQPGSPSIPSLDADEQIDASIKLRAVGRKRNTFGKALGDILLKEGQTVEALTSAAIRQAFAEQGYTVITSKEQAVGVPYTVDASIDKFWSWMNPGFASITLSTEISTSLSVKSPGGADLQTVYVKASDNYQTGMEENWVEVINKAVRAYVDALKKRLK